MFTRVAPTIDPSCLLSREGVVGQVGHFGLISIWSARMVNFLQQKEPVLG